MTEHTYSLSGVWPALSARDARGLIRFLVDGLGFQETVVHGDGDRVDHSELAWPAGGGLMLGSFKEDAEWLPRPGAARTYLVSDDPDAVFERALAAGAESLYPPRDTDYGSRECAVRDPEGNCWMLGTYQGAAATA